MVGHIQLESIIIFAIIVTAILFLAPQLVQVANIQGQMELTRSQTSAQIARESANAAVAPTLSAITAQIESAKAMSYTNSVVNANLLGQAQVAAVSTATAEKARNDKAILDAKIASDTALANAKIASDKVIADAQADAARRISEGEAERNRWVGYASLTIVLSIMLIAGVFFAGRYYNQSQSSKQQFLLEKGKLEIRQQEIVVLNRAVESLAQCGGTMLLENGRQLTFTPQLSLPAPVEIPVEKKEVACVA